MSQVCAKRLTTPRAVVSAQTRPHHDASSSQIREAHSSSVRGSIRIRKALPSDYETVCNLADLVEGQDFLFGLYNYFVADEDSHTIVATIDDKVVGFYMTTALDGGRTIMRRAARVDTNYRGRGVYLAMEAELERFIREDCPRTEYAALCKSSTDDHFIGRFQRQGYEQVYRRKLTLMIVKQSTAQTTDVDKTALDMKTQPREMTIDELTLLFRAKDVTKELFPAGRIFNFYLDYRPVVENVRLLICDRGGAFVSFLDAFDSGELDVESDEQTKTPHEDVSNASGESRFAHDVAMVTFYYYLPTLTKPCYYVDVYARPGVSRGHFRAHLQKHLELLRKNYPGQDSNLSISYERTVSRDVVLASLREVGVVDLKPFQHPYQVLYERKQARHADLIKTTTGRIVS